VQEACEGAHRVHESVMDLIEYFERQKQRCERELKYAEAADFRLSEKTAEGERDITEEHIQQLRKSRDDYQRMIDHLRSRGGSLDSGET
jgi:cob(I)alamin adenosyltransferase